MIGMSIRPSPELRHSLRLLALFGVMTFAAGLLLDPPRLWLNLLLVGYFLVTLSLAGAVLIALQYVMGATWGIAIRRIPEAMARLLPIGSILLLLVFLLHPEVYPWVREPAGEHGFRAAWLYLPFFRLRAVLYLLAWSVFVWAMLRESARQDNDGDFGHTVRNRKLAAGFLVVFSLTFWLASFDWVMSLEPHWYSTIFGLYNFGGLFLAGVAAITLIALWLRGRGPLRDFITLQHLHDLGRLMFAFGTFWAYLWFCQYMLIWYTNIPEETEYFVHRLHGFWQPLFYLNLFLNWVLPFFLLMTHGAKRRAGVLTMVALALLVGRWLDLYLMIAPAAGSAEPLFGIWEIGMMTGAVGFFGMGLLAALQSAPLVPVSDPQLQESLHHHA